MGALSQIPGKWWTMAALSVGYAALNWLDQDDQNSLGNFLMLVGQLLTTAAGQAEPACLPGGGEQLQGEQPQPPAPPDTLV